MATFPISLQHFTGGQNVVEEAVTDDGLPKMLNDHDTAILAAAAAAADAALGSTGIDVMSGAVDLSAASAAVVLAADRKTTTNTGAGRAYTLPTFATAPDDWTHTFMQLSAHDLTITNAGTDTINGVDGTVVLNSAQEWAIVYKPPGATGWVSLSVAAPVISS